MVDFKDIYNNWIVNAPDLRDELTQMSETEIEDAFYRNLEFGTGGLRGIIGAGTNRMNVYTVAKASQGLADYVMHNYPDNPKIAIAYDSRIKSDLFSRVAAEVFAANGIEVYIYPEPAPTPMLSFAVRYYGCAAGVVITASHNPAKYNGYKVYGPDGCQITTEAAADILAEIEKLDIFSDVKRPICDDKQVGTDNDSRTYTDKSLCHADKSSHIHISNNQHIHIITEDCYTSFIEYVKKQSVLYGDEIDKDVTIVYSPLNGAGLKPVTRVLRESGFENVVVVEEQKNPDGNFPTCPYPNPEIKEALALGLDYAERLNADLMLATDPDSDRVGIAVRDGNEMKLLSGNEVGALLLDFICSQRIKHDRMPDRPVMIKTIVTTDLAERIAEHYGVKTINVLTGFKFIGEQIGLLDEKGEADRYIFGFEESYGYLSGSYVRDKDAVDAALLICEMFAYYRTRGVSLVEKLDELYREYGYYKNTLQTYEFEGPAGMAEMKRIMAKLRETVCVGSDFGGLKVESIEDYIHGINGLPASDVIKYRLEGDASVVVRPSGTEPKLKVYIKGAGGPVPKCPFGDTFGQ